MDCASVLGDSDVSWELASVGTEERVVFKSTLLPLCVTLRHVRMAKRRQVIDTLMVAR